MNDIANEDPTYKLGRVVFTVENCQDDFKFNLSKILPITREAREESEIQNVAMGCIRDVRELVNHVLRKHFKCFWMDAASLISPSGKKILICGRSGAGKSTTSMALALGYNWKLLAEDIVLIDPDSAEIISFGSPFSFKEGTIELLSSTIGITIENLVLSEWLSTEPYMAAGIHYAPFDAVIFLERDQNKMENLQLNELTTSEYVRKVLLLSNLVRKRGTERFASFIEEGRKVQMTGGTLGQRLRLVHHLCDEQFNELENSDGSTVPSTPRREDDGKENCKPTVLASNKYRRAANVETTILDDGYSVLTSALTEQWAYTLTPAGSLVWEYCSGDLTVAEISFELASLQGKELNDELLENSIDLVSELVEGGLLLKA